MMIKFRREKNHVLFSASRSSLKRLGPLLFPMFVLSAISCAGQQTDPGNQRPFPKDYPVIHPQFRKWTYPSGNNAVSSLQPILQWPIHTKRYMRLTMSGFQWTVPFKAVEIIQQENINWTLFNPHQKLIRVPGIGSIACITVHGPLIKNSAWAIVLYKFCPAG